MKTKKLLTVITPTYNRAHTLFRAYQSLKNQSYEDFKWLIMDDGSTDDTIEVVQSIQKEGIIEVEYEKSKNCKKFYTVFKAIETIQTKYFTILDSDDAYPKEALKILVDEAENLDSEQFISVIGHSENERGELVGDLFPHDGFDGSVLEMRYKYKIKGDKNGIFITKPYQKYLQYFDYEYYKNMYAPQKIFYSIYDGGGMKTRFINKVIRTYYFDQTDKNSMSKDRKKSSSYLGLKDGHLSFLNHYNKQLWNYPQALFRNLVGYQVYCILLNQDFDKTVCMLKPRSFKFFSIILYPLSYFYTKSKLN